MLLKQQERVVPELSPHFPSDSSLWLVPQRGKRILAFGAHPRGFQHLPRTAPCWTLKKQMTEPGDFLGFFFPVFPPSLFHLNAEDWSRALPMQTVTSNSSKKARWDFCGVLFFCFLEFGDPTGESSPQKCRQPIRTKCFTFCSPARTTSSAPCKPHDKFTWYARTWVWLKGKWRRSHGKYKKIKKLM